MAWFSAPAPTICTSTVPDCRMTPAIAPATAFGLERLETFRTSTRGDEGCDGVPTDALFDAPAQESYCRLCPISPDRRGESAVRTRPTAARTRWGRAPAA